ncbi:hypothetical protein Mapa_012053 [Marchantia paleacea]|nr:hypothetical protein Mapa_012053 [Marchantia paleacea]
MLAIVNFLLKSSPELRQFGKRDSISESCNSPFRNLIREFSFYQNFVYLYCCIARALDRWIESSTCSAEQIGAHHQYPKLSLCSNASCRKYPSTLVMKLDDSRVD